MKLIAISFILFGVSGFFTMFPIVMWFGFRIGYFMDEYMRMSMLAFFFLGSGLTLSLTIWYLQKYNMELKIEGNKVS
ncbi:MAG: hypothetical protein O6761_06520 [Thaumarchaeota archaeon]|nr:hypothetical protein [Nitrososphaerota archaeon]